MPNDIITMSASKKSISGLLDIKAGIKYIIPEYQRPYKWDIEKCGVLWNDIEESFRSPTPEGRKPSDKEYFLGSIVTYINDGNYEIIDGQQRIISFLLLLRAFYRQLKDPSVTENVEKLKRQIISCIWETDKLSGDVNDESLIHIESKVAIDSDNIVFHNILITGDTLKNSKDNYTKNYNYFRDQCETFAKDNPTAWYYLCDFILNNCFILPIECDSIESALTIFYTLNDRGMPLSDADIFKAKMYGNLKTQEEQIAFTDQWKDLTHVCKQAELEVDDIFRYYMHVIRAEEGVNTREVGLRRFYADKNYAYLKRDNLLDDLLRLANFWRHIKARRETNSEGYKISLESRKWLHCLSKYPNDYWLFPISVFFLKNWESSDFDNTFCDLLKNEVAFLFALFIIKPTINAVRPWIYKAYISIAKNDKLVFSQGFLRKDLENSFRDYSSPSLFKALLLLYAYLDEGQKELVPEDFEIEHIFPKKWQNTNYFGWNKKDADEWLEKYGNKVVIEEKLNIRAGNGYFGIKKEEYRKSNISVVRKLGNKVTNDWTKADIEEREMKFFERIMKFFNRHLPEDSSNSDNDNRQISISDL